MSDQPIQDVNVHDTIPLVAPRYLKSEEQMSDAAMRTVLESREIVKRILAGEDKRMMVIVGPCSIHDPVAALDYARKLQRVAEIGQGQTAGHHAGLFREAPDHVGWKG